MSKRAAFLGVLVLIAPIAASQAGVSRQNAQQASDRSSNVHVVSTHHLPRAARADDALSEEVPPFLWELGFRGNLIIAGVGQRNGNVKGGSESGFAIYRSTRHSNDVRLLSHVRRCGATGDIAVWRNLVVVAMQNVPAASGGCGRRGIAIYDIEDPRKPHEISFVRSCGDILSMTPVSIGRDLYIYSSDCSDGGENPTGLGVFSEALIFKIPGRDPEAASRAGVWDLSPMNGCTEISVMAAQKRAACLGDGRMAIYDLKDPANPVILTNPPVVVPGAAALATGTFSWDGRYLLVGDARPSCSVSNSDLDPYSLYEVEDAATPVLVGTWRQPRSVAAPGDADCLSKSVSAVPTRDGSYFFGISDGQIGTSLLQFEPSIGFKDFAFYQPTISTSSATTHSLNWHNGHFFVPMIGLDPETGIKQTSLHVLKIDGFDHTSTFFFNRSFNPETVDDRFLN